MNNMEQKNNLLSLYKEFQSKKKARIKYEIPFFNEVQNLTTSYIKNLIEQLVTIKKVFDSDKLLEDKVVVTVFCKKIMAPSNRLSWLFSFEKKQSNDYIVGSAFYGEANGKQNITYAFEKQNLEKAICRLRSLNDILEREFNGFIDKKTINELMSDKERYRDGFGEIAKTNVLKTFGQLTYIDYFGIRKYQSSPVGESIVTFIHVPGVEIKNILKNIDINLTPIEIMEDTFLLSEEDYKKISETAPYLIAYQSENFAKIDAKYFDNGPFPESYSIPKPSNEPIIGVIDGPFAKGHDGLVMDAYFSDWVECFDDFEAGQKANLDIDYCHGTEVSSLIVDLPTLNPHLDDGCGRFRVRHFGIARSQGTSSVFMMKKIREIIKDPKNSDIKVWNICLGNKDIEINDSFISYEGALLDELQNENPNIVIVVSGTNKPLKRNGEMKIGAPADSINSIIVNSCTLDEKPASYSRCGPALSFFVKPDVSTFGGDKNEEINVWTPWGKHQDAGTSLAAPLISRKMAFLMCVMGFGRNVAKALLIDAATSWVPRDEKEAKFIGRGVIQTPIERILKSEKDEIKFYIQGSSVLHDTYTYTLPVPVCDDNKYHYRAKATLCYFPKCSRAQGVDYTNIELTLKVGRLTNDGRIDSIQSTEDFYERGFCFEKEARKIFRKWDNIKTINNYLTTQKKNPLIVKNSANKNWGISITYQDRKDPNHKERISWGLVVSLKATDGVNRYSDFIHSCELNGWLVSEIKLENRLIVQNELDQEINFDD